MPTSVLCRRRCRVIVGAVLASCREVLAFLEGREVRNRLKTRESVGNGRNRVETRKVGFNVEKPNGIIGRSYWFASSSFFVASVQFAPGQYLVWPRQVQGLRINMRIVRILFQSSVNLVSYSRVQSTLFLIP